MNRAVAAIQTAAVCGAASVNVSAALRTNGYIESFNGKLRDELLNGEIFYTLKEAQVLIERWRRHYNAVRPHSALGSRPPAPEALEPKPLRLAGGLTLGVVQ